MKLLHMQIFKYLHSIFLTTSVYCLNKILNWYKTHFSWTWNKNNKLFSWSFFSVSEGPLFNTLKLFFSSAKCFNFFLHIHEKFISYQFMILNRKIHWCCQNKVISFCIALKNPHAFFILPKKVLVCSIDTLKVFFGTIIYYLGQCQWKGFFFVSIQDFYFYKIFWICDWDYVIII